MKKLPQFFYELKRRHVFSALVGYVAFAAVLLEILDNISRPLGLPPTLSVIVLVLFIMGLPLVLGLAWYYEITQQGVEVDDEAAGESGGGEQPVATAEESHDPRVPAPRRPTRWAVPLGLVVVVVAAGTFYMRSSDEFEAQPIRSIAVLPFTDFSATQDQAYFGYAIAEELLDALSRVPGLRVVARSSSFQFADLGVDVRQVGDSLGVDAVLEGSLRRDGRRIRVNAQLIRVADHSHIWSGRYDREIQDVFSVQAGIAGAVADTIRAFLGTHLAARGSAAPGSPPPDSDAYLAFLQGRAAQHSSGADSAAATYFREAVRLDPGFARAHAALAESQLRITARGGDPTGAGAREEVLSAAERALALDPNQPTAAAVLGYLLALDGRLEEAGRVLSRVLEGHPGHVQARRWYAEVLEGLGRTVEAAEQEQALRQLDPLRLRPEDPERRRSR